MPIYDYHCAHCGPFSALRAIARRDEPGTCPACGTDAGRVLVATPALPLLADEVRTAHATNERSRHEPRASRGHRHGPGCGCSGKVAAAPAGTTAPALKGFASKRPWMISH